MKFNKSGLLSSLAVAGIVLGAVAPVVANAAADPDLAFNNAGQNHAFTDSGDAVTLKTNTPDAALSNVGASYATSTSAESDDKTPATGVSDGYVYLISGFLTLDDVPDFNFGTVAVGSTGYLVNNSGAIGDDGNSDGVLQVTDSRSTVPGSGSGTSATPGSQDGRGYSLSVRLGNFYQLNAKGERAGSAFSGFKLTIPDLSKAKDANGQSLVSHDPKTTPYVYAVDAQSNGVQSDPLLQASAGTSYGTTSITMKKDSKISLSTDSKATKGAYDAPIYWILTADPA